MNKEIQEKIEQLQVLEHNVQHISTQKQSMQAQLIEIGSALKALDKNKKQAFKIIGAVMIESTKEELVKDLSEKKEFIEVKLKNYEKQEEKLRESAKKI